MAANGCWITSSSPALLALALEQLILWIAPTKQIIQITISPHWSQAKYYLCKNNTTTVVARAVTAFNAFIGSSVITCEGAVLDAQGCIVHVDGTTRKCSFIGLKCRIIDWNVGPTLNVQHSSKCACIVLKFRAIYIKMTTWKYPDACCPVGIWIGSEFYIVHAYSWLLRGAVWYHHQRISCQVAIVEYHVGQHHSLRSEKTVPSMTIRW